MSDINGLGAPFDDEASFTFLNVIRDDAVPRDGPLRICHPVLDGPAFAAKTAFHRANQRLRPLALRVRKALLGRFNRMLAW